MRKKIVAANWKMNLSIEEGKSLVNDVLAGLPALQESQLVIFCCPFIHLSSMRPLIREANSASIQLGAQNCHPAASGAFTGEVSIPMLKEVGVESVIIGHSERRQYFGETNEFLKSKLDALVAAGMHVLFCCGEPLTIRELDQQNEYVGNQLKESLFHLSADQIKASVTIAYEPIWAIGTGMTATTAQAQEMHAYIRSLIAGVYGQDTASEISILYGGSCNANNADELFACEDVDGGLIGGAALKADTFLPIVKAIS